MIRPRQASYRVVLSAALGLSALVLAGCSGDDGAPGAPGQPGAGIASVSDAKELNFVITGVAINSAPVVSFSVTNQDGTPVTGFAETDLRFNIAKLRTGTPTKWQNYILRTRGTTGNIEGSQERKSTGYQWGTLIDNKNGTFTYTFATDITLGVTCPAGATCTEADGTTALNLSYEPSLVHRVGIQQGNSALPRANATYDFIPAGGAITDNRDIVTKDSCNECHNELRVHGSRVETKLCVTCHNPGSWVAGTPNTTVDFKVMVHKIHRGSDLPTVAGCSKVPNPPDVLSGCVLPGGGTYKIGNADFSTVVFPFSAVNLGDTRSCTKCHDGTVGAKHQTAQGDNWKNVPTIAACGACHDNVKFNVLGSGTGGADDNGHPGGVVDSNTDCLTCHKTGLVGRAVDELHNLPNLIKAEGAKYQFNILEICGVAVGANPGPVCAPGVTPTVKFSVTNPTVTPATTYNIKTDPAFACVAGPGGGVPASLSMLIGWNNVDENNVNSGSNPGQPYNVGVLDSYSSGTQLCTANANVADSGSGTFTVTFTGKPIPATGVSGSGRAALYGRVTLPGSTERVRIRAAYRDFRITDGPLAVARRQVVDINKCINCHDQVSLHGESRTNEPGLCVICHNPSATDINRRPRANLAAAVSPGPCVAEPGALANAVNCDPLAGGSIDSKKEEAIDFKRMIHGIHAGAKTDLSGGAAHGFRNKGLVVYGFYSGAGPANPVDFSHVRFPGFVRDCLTCHLAGTYELTGRWELPTINGVLGSSINTAPLTTDSFALQSDDLNITPTAAVCSACHDGPVAQSHMQLNGALFAATQATIDSGAILEACAICHAPGRVADVKVMHGVK